MANKENLIIYYSYSGNTRYVAEILQNTIGGTLASIRLEDKYPEDKEAMFIRTQKEINENCLPHLKTFPVKIYEYKKIFIGTPVWWYSASPPMKRFLKQFDFSNKLIFPFITNEKSTGHAMNDIISAIRNGTIKTGLTVRFSENRLLTPKMYIKTWAKRAMETEE